MKTKEELAYEYMVVTFKSRVPLPFEDVYSRKNDYIAGFEEATRLSMAEIDSILETVGPDDQNIAAELKMVRRAIMKLGEL